jgi:hypothetical protein
MVQKMLLCLNKISVEILFRILGYGFCAEHHYFAHFCPIFFALKVLKNICAKAALLWHQNCE